ncbi:hypothetical protein [Falsirhodobacter halotolerans]|uniref:hypothetical protein n=1 Tax=Falsirhodobacter halotolerans TaxID=1146892 RepID=UPI001FD2FCCA|nr:hypothetical protein [Falsirhodobacter halotolerans]MCJ8141074.1 hypothetical protein [Falsirhodobacter halotolerans]
MTSALIPSRGLAPLLATLTAFACGPAAAQVWADRPYDYVVLDQDIRTTLQEFGRNMGVSVQLTDAVRGRVRGRVEGETAGDFIETLARTHGLVWYDDGAVLNVSAAREFATHLVSAGDLNAEAALRQMRDLGLVDDRFTLRATEGGGVISVSGPPAYVTMVEDFVRNQRPALAAAGDDPRVRVYRGRVGIEDVPTAPTPEN